MPRADVAHSLERSAQLFRAAQQLLPGGVNSPVRAFRAVAGTPPFIARGSGARLADVDGNEYIDYVLSWGALPLGHAHPAVVRALHEQATRGTSFGAPTELESALAALIVERMPSVEMVRFVSSGTEAVMSAIRLARAATGRNLIVKFDGCYHGHMDALLVSAGSGIATLGLPDSAGVPQAAVRDTLSLRYNDLAAVEEAFRNRGTEIAALIVEPIAGNMGLVMPAPGFLDGLRRVTAEHGALLIFDEVMTGARVSAGGAQALFGIRPDLTTLGKVIGGGLPVAAYGGRRELMQLVAPLGPVYQAGTLSGNPLAMASGIATLRQLSGESTYERLHAQSTRVATGLKDCASRRGIPMRVAAIGGMWGFFFADEEVKDYEAARRTDAVQFRTFFHECLRRGVYLAPSPFEASFMSTAHDDATVSNTLEVFDEALAAL